MEKFAFLLEGYTPIMLFIFICFAALLVIFWRTMRGLDDLVKSGKRGGKGGGDDALGLMSVRLEELVRMQAETLVVLKSMTGMSVTGAAPSREKPYRIPDDQVESIDYALGGVEESGGKSAGAVDDLDESFVMQATMAVAGARSDGARGDEAVAFAAEDDDLDFSGLDDDLDLGVQAEEAGPAGSGGLVDEELGLDIAEADLDMSGDLDLSGDLDMPSAEPVTVAAPPEPPAEVPSVEAMDDEDMSLEDLEDELDLSAGLFDDEPDSDETPTLLLESSDQEAAEPDEDDALSMLGGDDAPPPLEDDEDAEDATMLADLEAELGGLEPSEITPEPAAPPAAPGLDVMGADDLEDAIDFGLEDEEEEEDDLSMEVAEAADEDEPADDDDFMEEAGQTLRMMQDDMLAVDDEDESLEAKAARSLHLEPMEEAGEPEAAPAGPPPAPEVEDELDGDIDLGLTADLQSMDIGEQSMEDLLGGPDEPLEVSMDMDDTADEPDLDSTMALDDLVDRLELTGGSFSDEDLGIGDADSMEDDIAEDLSGGFGDMTLDETPEPPPAPAQDEDEDLDFGSDLDLGDADDMDLGGMDDDSLSATMFMSGSAEDLEDVVPEVAGDPADDTAEGDMSSLGLAGPEFSDDDLGMDLGDDLGLTLDEDELAGLGGDDELKLEAGDIDVPDEVPAMEPMDEDDEDMDIRLGSMDDGISLDDTATFDLDDLTNGLDDVQVEIMSGVDDGDSLTFDDMGDEGLVETTRPADEDLSMTMDLSEDDLLDLTMDEMSDEQAGDTMVFMDNKKGGKGSDGENIVDYIIEE